MFRLNTFIEEDSLLGEDDNYLESILDEKAVALQEELLLENVASDSENEIPEEFNSMFDGIEI